MSNFITVANSVANAATSAIGGLATKATNAVNSTLGRQASVPTTASTTPAATSSAATTPASSGTTTPTNAGAAAAQQAQSSQAQLLSDKTQFLTLLTSQLKNQDPLSPMDSSQFTQQRLIARLTLFFGVLSLVLASIGVYGVTAYNAGRRTGEIGVRMALGASRGDVVRLVLRGAFVLILIGLGLGLPLTFAAGRLLGPQLYGMSPYKLGVTVVSVVVLGLAALMASVVPRVKIISRRQ